MSKIGQPYTSGSWVVKPGNEEDFVARWTEFTGWAVANASGAESFVLIRQDADPRRFVLELLDELKAAGQEVNSARLGEQTVARTVCRHAVKANDPLSGPELENLVEDLRGRSADGLRSELRAEYSAARTAQRTGGTFETWLDDQLDHHRRHQRAEHPRQPPRPLLLPQSHRRLGNGQSGRQTAAGRRLPDRGLRPGDAGVAEWRGAEEPDRAVESLSLAGLRPPRSSDGACKADITLFRSGMNGKERLTADADTELQPGDVIEVALRPEGVDIAAQ